MVVQEVQRQGTSAEKLVLDWLRAEFRPQPAVANSAGSLADFLGDHLGILSSSEFVTGGASISENCGGKFANALVEKRLDNRSVVDVMS